MFYSNKNNKKHILYSIYIQSNANEQYKTNINTVYAQDQDKIK